MRHPWIALLAHLLRSKEWILLSGVVFVLVTTTVHLLATVSIKYTKTLAAFVIAESACSKTIVGAEKGRAHTTRVGTNNAVPAVVGNPENVVRRLAELPGPVDLDMKRAVFNDTGNRKAQSYLPPCFHASNKAPRIAFAKPFDGTCLEETSILRNRAKTIRKSRIDGTVIHEGIGPAYIRSVGRDEVLILVGQIQVVLTNGTQGLAG
jgi:hypothetical protein